MSVSSKRHPADIFGCYRQLASERQKQAMAKWNYRVVEPLGRPEHFIAEVLYEGDKLSWVDDSRDCVRWDRYDDLKPSG